MKRKVVVCLGVLIVLIASEVCGWSLHRVVVNSRGNGMWENISYIVRQACDVVCVIDGEEVKVDKDNVMREIVELFDGGREMPALGVALHEDIVVAKRSGVWVELVYGECISYNDMSFDKLLINVEPSFSGINIIRHVNGKYDGRCYYVALTGDMSNIYECITHQKKK